jgi:hypothetical protein
MPSLEIIRSVVLFPSKLKDWVLLAGLAACGVVWFAVGDALRALF